MTVAQSSIDYSCIRCGFISIIRRAESIQTSHVLDAFAHSNEPPLATEIEILCKEYGDVTLAVASMDTEIARLRDRLAAAESRREMLSKRGEAYRSALHPCRRLPNEILGHIFRISVDEDIDISPFIRRPGPYTGFPFTFDTQRSPWVLGQVCRRWRDLVLSLPELWTAVDLDCQKGIIEERVHPFIEHRLSLRLERAQDRSLFISWYQDTCWDGVLTLLHARTAQWKSVAIRAGLKDFRYLATFGASFPMLSTLCLHFERDLWSRLEESDTVFSVFRNAPALQDLQLSGVPRIATRLSNLIPWRQITRFALKGFHGQSEDSIDIQHILPLLENVEDTSLYSFNFLGSPLTTPVKLLHLQSLSVYSDTLTLARSLFRSLTLPALRSVEIGIFWLDEHYGRMVQPFLQFLRRSSCQLESAEFYYFDDADLLDILRGPEMQGVHKLSLGGQIRRDYPLLTDHHNVSDEVLNALQLARPGETGRPGLLLPHLRTLLLSGIKEWSDKALVDMVISRRQVDHLIPGSVSRLERVEIYLDNATGSLVQNEEASAILDSLKAEGLLMLVEEASWG
ncbi:hypothetical protein V5O48_008279 [Marasmius crinis-equi]|uniref:F-box domain-containing protein n=1 Tax=Marasmius crinis-equi TaxID=585013 RepID=A0ABR3FEL3_9AGAR